MAHPFPLLEKGGVGMFEETRSSGCGLQHPDRFIILTSTQASEVIQTPPFRKNAKGWATRILGNRHLLRRTRIELRAERKGLLQMLRKDPHPRRHTAARRSHGGDRHSALEGGEQPQHGALDRKSVV